MVESLRIAGRQGVLTGSRVLGRIFPLVENYRTPRGQHERSENKWPLQSIDRIAQFDAYAKIAMISPPPLLMIVGSKADTAYFSEEAIAEAAEPKEQFVVDGACHIDLYDVDQYVTPAVEKLDEFFGKGLAG
ncbi:alpha/beta hydrolase family protein [Nocardia asteroides]|uniref:hypothetical protein n=1 Tax=Nocardia asteroides TaxID=1824 RepID=UPI003663E228